MAEAQLGFHRGFLGLVLTVAIICWSLGLMNLNERASAPPPPDDRVATSSFTPLWRTLAASCKAEAKAISRAASMSSMPATGLSAVGTTPRGVVVPWCKGFMTRTCMRKCGAWFVW